MEQKREIESDIQRVREKEGKRERDKEKDRERVIHTIWRGKHQY